MTTPQTPRKPRGAAESFVVGESVVIDCVAIKIDDVLTDPTAFYCYVADPDGTSTDATTYTNGTGLASALYVPTKQGWHKFRVEGTGTAPFMREGKFYAVASSIT